MRHSRIFDFTDDLAEQSSLVRLMISAVSSGMPSLDRVRVKKAGGLRVDHVADEVMWTTAYFNRPSTSRRGVDFLWAADSSRHVDQEVEETDEEEDDVDEPAEEVDAAGRGTSPRPHPSGKHSHATRS